MGENATLTCGAFGEPTPNITWESELFPEGRYNITVDTEGVSQLVIQPVMPEDEGVYTCFAFNIYGNSTADAFLQPLSKYCHLMLSIKVRCSNKYLRLKCLVLCLKESDFRF